MSSRGSKAEFARSLARKARADLDALVVLHERGGIADAVIGFHAQQADWAEKLGGAPTPMSR